MAATDVKGFKLRKTFFCLQKKFGNKPNSFETGDSETLKDNFFLEYS